MKINTAKTMVIAALAVTMATSGLAFGQGNNGRGPGDRDRGQQANERSRQDNDRGRRDNDRGRQDNDRGRNEQQRGNEGRERGAGPNHDYYRGQRLPVEYRHRSYVVDDWRGHQLTAPPRGYHWVQTGGDYLLVAIATGIILQVFLGR
jgi:Ni/Co efflux regulator RcnB